MPICYRDTTYCPYFDTCVDGGDCTRALTEAVEEAAEEFGLPICQWVEEPDCYTGIFEEEND